ncbi:MAG TPA: ABC transporter permease [Longimicrobiaceae bacterium]|nr:ABC transporter permease [Longimicrobiaceae bacterium]
MIRPGIRRLFRLPVRGAQHPEADLDEEIRLHLELRAEQLEREGLPPEQAREAARRRFGPPDEARRTLREAARRRESRVRLREWAAGVRQDLRYALRTLGRSPGFTAVAVLTLGLGIGANTAIFSVVDGVLLRPLPLPDADRLVVVWETDRNSGTTREPASVPDFVDFREQATQLRGLAALIPLEANYQPDDGDPSRLAALAVSHELLPTVGVEPLLGRGFTPEEDRPGGPAVALIGERLWTRELGRDPGVLGRTLRLNGRSHTVIGVVPSRADFGVPQVLSAAAYGGGFADRGDRVEVDVWLPLQPRSTAESRATHPAFLVGRLGDGATTASAQREMDGIAAALERAHPVNAGRGVFVEPLREVVFGPVRPALLLLLGAVGMVLLIACANVANLLLARGAARTHEIAVRSALGAGRRRLARLFLVESLVLALLGAGLGVALAHLGLHALTGLAPQDVARLGEVRIDLRTLGAALAVAVAVGVVFGMLPILQTRGADLQGRLRGGAGRGATAGRARSGMRSALVAAEVGVAVVLLVGAGLLVKSFWQLLRVDPGFRAEQVLKAEYQLPADRYPQDYSRWPDWSEVHRFNAGVLERVGALPGVEAAAVAGVHPLSAGFTNSFSVVGREAEAADWPEIPVRQVAPGYFRTLGVALRRGRLLGPEDDTRAPAVALVNEAAARRFFAGRDPLGQQVSLWGSDRTIVGVVENERFQGLGAGAPPALYLPLAQAPSAGGSVLLRVRGDPAALAGALRAAVRQQDPALAVFGVEALERTLARSVGRERFTTLLTGLFAALALVLATVGVHGVLSYSVAERSREIGIRMALGAEQGRVVRQVVAQGLLPALAGAAVGLAGAVGLGRLLASLLYEVSTTDAAVLGGVVGILLAVTLLASWLPARRAARVDPVAALRGE